MKFEKPRNNLSKYCSTTAAALALGILSTTSAYTQVVAGLDTWDNGSAPTVPVVLSADITATATASATGGTWSVFDSGADPGRGSSDDGTWGSYDQGVAASTVTDIGAANMTLTNAKTDGELTLTIVNNGTEDLNLGQFHFDAVAFRFKAARTFTLDVLTGSDISVGNVFSSDVDAVTSLNGGLSGHSQHDEFDIDLTSLADSTLEAGGTAIFQLSFSNGVGDGSGGHHLFLDNVAVTLVSTLTDKLVVTSAPASATAGEDFAITVQAQDVNGNPLNVTSDTTIDLATTGTGTLSGGTATILSGTSSVTLSSVQYTVAEDITVTASSSAGDALLTSEDSSIITIVAGPATALTVETAADGSGTAIGDTSVFIGVPFDFFAISRDSVGNFINFETGATFSLVNATDGVTSSDLVDNLDGSATLTPVAAGTGVIRATLAGFTDADSGTITVEQLENRYDGGTNSSPNWSTAIVWEGDVLPAFDNQTDIFMFNNDITKVFLYLGQPLDGVTKRVRSVNFDEATTKTITFSHVTNGSTGSADLIFDTDSTTDPAEFNIDAASSGNINWGASNGAAPEAGNTVLADNLLVTHNGTGNLIINNTISELDGSFGITKTGSGLLELSGSNTYTGSTTVNEGILQLDGDAINDSATLIIEGTGQVEVEAGETESVTALFLGGVSQAEGTYGPTGSGADNIDDVNFTASSGLINVGTPMFNAYELFANVITDANLRDIDDDADGDGIPNGIEFVIGGTPLDSSDLPLLPCAEFVNADLGNGATDYIQFSYRSVTDAVLLDPGVEYDTDLQAEFWTFAIDGFNGIIVQTTVDGYEAGVDRVDTYIPASLAVDEKLFGRLSVLPPS